MDNESIRTMLLDIHPSELDFTVTLTGKKSRKVNGLYKPDTREILLHNKNFESDNELTYTAVHEYTHHLINEESLKASGGLEPLRNARVHTNYFWAKFHDLLEEAEKKGYYRLDLSLSPELKALTDEIKSKYIEPNGRLMQEFGLSLMKAYKLCEASHIRYEDYINRVLQLPRATERALRRVGQLPKEDADLGFDIMKIVASCTREEDRARAVEAVKSGKSPDTVIAQVRRRRAEKDPRELLEKEKARLEKTIQALSRRLELVEEKLADL